MAFQRVEAESEQNRDRVSMNSCSGTVDAYTPGPFSQGFAGTANSNLAVQRKERESWTISSCESS